MPSAKRMPGVDRPIHLPISPRPATSTVGIITRWIRRTSTSPPIGAFWSPIESQAGSRQNEPRSLRGRGSWFRVGRTSSACFWSRPGGSPGRMLGAMPRAGFTGVEVLVALVVFAVAALGLAAEMAALTRLLAQGHRAAVVTQAASNRLDGLRANGCRSRTNGGETLSVNSVPIAEIIWSWTDRGDSIYGLTLRAAPIAVPGGSHLPHDTLAATLWCRR